MKSARKILAPTIIAVIAMLATSYGAAALAQRTLSTGEGSNRRIAYAGYSLKLVFALRAGPYVAGVDVRIFDESGAKIVDAYSQGPWFLADLLPGTYRVVARRKTGPAAAAMVTISAGKQQRVFLTW